MLVDESCIARESQNAPAPARASDRLLSISGFYVLGFHLQGPVDGHAVPSPGDRRVGRGCICRGGAGREAGGEGCGGGRWSGYSRAGTGAAVSRPRKDIPAACRPAGPQRSAAGRAVAQRLRTGAGCGGGRPPRHDRATAGEGAVAQGRHQPEQRDRHAARTAHAAGVRGYRQAAGERKGRSAAVSGAAHEADCQTT